MKPVRRDAAMPRGDFDLSIDGIVDDVFARRVHSIDIVESACGLTENVNRSSHTRRVAPEREREREMASDRNVKKAEIVTTNTRPIGGL